MKSTTYVTYLIFFRFRPSRFWDARDMNNRMKKPQFVRRFELIDK